MAVNFPKVMNTSHEPAYFGAGYGLVMAVKLNLGNTTRINSFSSRMGYGGANYYGTNYTGSCTGTAALMRGAIWLKQPTSSDHTPDFVSDNIIDVASGGFLANTGPGLGGRKIIFKEFTWNFSNANCGKSEVWVGWIHDRYRDTKQTCVAFAVTSYSGTDNFSRLALNVSTMTSTSLRFGFTNFNASEPYKTPTIGISNNNVLISRYDVNRTINIAKNTSGDDSATTVKVNINGNEETTNIGNSSSDYTFKPSDKGVSDGANYTAKATRIHNSNNSLSAEDGPINLYTYRTPKISSVSVSPQTFSGTGNGTLKWSTNTRRWTTNPTENAFITYIKFENKEWFKASNNEPSSNDSTNSTYIEEQTITKNIIDTQFTADERSVDSISTKVYMRRNNPSSEVNADTSTGYSIIIRLKPQYAPSSVTYYNNNTNQILSKGSINFIDECPKVKISWEYPNNADRGIIDGYIVRIYSDANRTNKISEHTVNTSELASNVVVDIKTDLKRGQLNYVSITAFYNKSNGSGKLESSPLNENFIIPLGRLHKPVISYPISNTTWHNSNFRILLQSPQDDDYDTYDSNTISSYKYRNIELKINDKVFSLYNATENSSTSCISSGIIFCNNNVKHKAKICINPSLSNSFIDADTFKISIRFQKNYYQYVWSVWSDEIVIKKSAISELAEIKIDEPILAAHYNKMRNYSVRLWQVYPLQVLESKNVICEPSTDTSKQNDYITQDNYSAIYNTILGIKNNVNNYADSFDDNRQNCKFNQTIDKLSGDNAVTDELVTGEKDPRPNIPGRNYINILIECMNRLF